MVPLHTTFRAMASENELQLWAEDASQARAAAAAAIADVARIEAKYSRYRDDSVTTRINRAAGGSAVAIDTETLALLRYADQCHTVSGGLFDLTSGVLRRVWDFSRASPRVPDLLSLAAATALVDWRKVEWDERAIRLPSAGMEIDFGGIGKEYAADRIASICTERGIEHGLANLGGDVRAVGFRPDGTKWRIGIRHPRIGGELIASLELANAAVATSGDYQRFFEIDGRRYCHVLHPRTGMPAMHWQSVSVVAPLCVVAGSCATIAMLLEAEAESFLAAQKIQYCAVAANGSVCGNAVTAAHT
ncbi:MAG: FAD:protein FMN transferase [Betaproteobacteria bacterium]|nr:FAD:protein FMN transferase [Betaproteobacteria bacterium]